MKRNTLYGLIGYPLSHSFSKGYFTNKFINEGIEGSRYLNFEINTIEKFREILIDYPDLKGLNVTIPYKKSVIPYLDHMSDDARSIGAVNTICINRSHGKTITTGYNTDHFGFSKTLDLLFDDPPPGALILGTGGASGAVKYSLLKRNIPYRFISRKTGTSIMSYKDIDQELLSAFPLIINTTPLGMYPDINNKPDIPYELLNQDNYLIDLIYNPDKTIFLELGEKAGAKIINGLPMLVEQAESSWKLWQNKA